MATKIFPCVQAEHLCTLQMLAKLELFTIYTTGLCVDGNVAVTCGTDGCVQKAVISQADTGK